MPFLSSLFGRVLVSVRKQEKKHGWEPYYGFWEETSEYFVFNNKEYSGVLDASGKELFRINLYHLQFLTNNILIYRDNFEYGLIDITGKILTDAKYTSIQKINDNHFLGIEDGFKVEVIEI